MTQYKVTVMDNGNSYNNEKIYYIRFSSELLTMITTYYALGHYFKKASDASYFIQMNLH